MYLIQCTAYDKFLINVRAVNCCYYEHHHSHYHHSYQGIKYKEKENFNLMINLQVNKSYCCYNHVTLEATQKRIFTLI